MNKPINQISDEDVMSVELNATFSTYQRAATKTAIYPGRGTVMGLLYCTTKLTGEAGEFSEHVGKAMRDDGLLSPISEDGQEQLGGRFGFYCNELTPARRDLLIKEAGDVLWYLAALSNELGIDLEEIAVANLRKLHSRSERGKLQGSGDNR